MKKIFKTIVLCALAIFTSCSEDIYDSHINDSNVTNKKKISLKQFKQETNIKDFKPYYKVPISASNVSSRTAELSEFVIDTVAIQKYISENNKTTYSFRIYSIVSSTQLDEKYNLVFTKENNVWEEVIVAFKEKLNATPSENQFEDLQKLYDSRFSYVTTSIASLVCISEGTLAHCTHTGPCESGRCDECYLCVTRILIVDFCEGSPGASPQSPGESNPPIDYSGAGYIPINPFEFTPNLYDNPAYDDQNAINQLKAEYFFNHLTPGTQFWVNDIIAPENKTIYLQLIQYQIDNNWSPESKAFANDMLNFEMEEDWKTELQLAIASGITSTAELTHKMYGKLSVIATNHPSSIYFINTVIDGFRAVAEPLIDTNPSTCDWTDLFTMWLFELGSNPIDFNGPTVTVLSLQNQEGVAQARAKAIAQITNNNLAPVNNPWIYGQGAFYQGMANGNIATSFLGSYITTVTITTLPNGQHQLTFHVTNSSTWDSATRLRIDNDHDGAHDGIFPNHVRNATNTLHIGGDFDQDWTWTETY